MALNSDNCTSGLGCTPKSIREAVCIDTRRIYDACSDKDCIRDLRVYFTASGQAVIDAASTVKVRKAEVVGVFFEMEPVAFNKGFYSVDITFFFKVKVAAYQNPAASPNIVYGLSVFSKKVILFGSDAAVKTFSNSQRIITGDTNKPIVNVQVIDPMVLSFNIRDIPNNMTPQCFTPPSEIADLFDSTFDNVVPLKILTVDLGLFSIVQLERQVQIMIPVYGFCVPEKQCQPINPTEDPCELFSKICFPTDDFFPPKMTDIND